MGNRQGGETQKFIRESRADDDKCYSMVQSYLHKCPESCEYSNRKRGPWAIAQDIERIKAASGVVHDKGGEMMWDKLYLEFATTKRGGGNSDDEALRKWNELEQAVKRTQRGSSTTKDRKGSCVFGLTPLTP